MYPVSYEETSNRESCLRATLLGDNWSSLFFDPDIRCSNGRIILPPSKTSYIFFLRFIVCPRRPTALVGFRTTTRGLVVIVITFSSKVFGNVGMRAFQGRQRGERTIEKTPFPAVRSVDGESDCQNTHHHSLTRTTIARIAM